MKRTKKTYAMALMLALALCSLLAFSVARPAVSNAQVCEVACNTTGVGYSFQVDDATLRQALATGINGAYFWTGRTNGLSVEPDAGRVATTFGGTTLEDALRRGNIPVPAFDDRTQGAIQAWEYFSTVFAEQARGVAFVVIGDVVRDGNVWETLERPELEANPEITKIMRIDPDTGQTWLIWERS